MMACEKRTGWVMVETDNQHVVGWTFAATRTAAVKKFEASIYEESMLADYHPVKATRTIEVMPLPAAPSEG